MVDDNDKIQHLKNKGGEQKPDILKTATDAINKARKESYEAKVKTKVQLLQEQRKSVTITEAEIQALVEEFESGL